MSLKSVFSTHNNGLIRCYNMFPSDFKNIEDMTHYLPHIKALGMNVVWINPIQEVGYSKDIIKSNMVTGQRQALKGSLYAMADQSMIHPKFSMIKRDMDGDILLTDELKDRYHDIPYNVINQIKLIRNKISENEQKERNLRKAITGAKKGRLERQIESTQKNLSSTEDKLKHLREQYNLYFKEQQTWIQHKDRLALKNFTASAKQLGITPIFDLVLNHLSIDAPFVKEHPEFFDEDDRTFPDAKAFLYGKLVRESKCSDEQRARIVNQIPKIIDIFWKPFIQTYINDLGFCGVRVDFVSKIPVEVRTPIYNLIREGVQAQENPAPVVILEESLFSDITVEEFVKKVKAANATHNIGSVHYNSRIWDGGLKFDHKHEDYHKSKLVQNGVINFTGSHDHYSCAMSICRELAYERLKHNPQLYSEYCKSIEKLSKSTQQDDEPSWCLSVEIIKSIFIHYYVEQIISELNNSDEYNDEINYFGQIYRDRIFTNVFAGSGGYYILSGDEFASFHQKSVFVRASGEDVYPKSHMRIFQPNSGFSEKAYEVLEKMAEKSVFSKKYKSIYISLEEANKKIFLSAFAKHIKHEIDLNVKNRKEQFIKLLIEAFNDQDFIDKHKTLFDDVLYPNHHLNRWGVPSSLDRFTGSKFFDEINQIVDKLPTSKEGFWSELFKVQNEDFVYAVRINGYGYSGHADVIIFNTNPHKTHDFGITDLHKIALWFQQRGFPIHSQNSDRHKAYACIMGSTHHNKRPANLYFGGKINLDQEAINNHHIDIDDKSYSFNLIISPKPPQKELLQHEPPTEFHTENHIDEQLLERLADLMSCNISESSQNPWMSEEDDCPSRNLFYDTSSDSDESQLYDSDSTDSDDEVLFRMQGFNM